jgi:hypothetical protein
MMFMYRYDAKQVMRGVKRTNTMYGGLQLQATRVVFVHGSIDPWHALGITRTIKQDSPAIYIRGVLLLYFFCGAPIQVLNKIIQFNSLHIY